MFPRGLAALILIFLIPFTLNATEFLYKDDVVHNPKFNETVNKLGQELYDKTGISLYMVMLRKLDNNETIIDYEQKMAKSLKEPFIILSFSELDHQIDIYAQPTILYKDFDKNRILSPNGNFISAVVTVVMFARDWVAVKEIMGNYGGVILPIISQKVKPENVIKKYSAGMYNGYSEIAEEVAKSRHVTLKNAAGNGSKDFINIIRLIFYGTILFAFYKYFSARRRAKKRDALKKEENE